MASTPVEIDAPSGLTLTLSLFALGSDTLANSDGADTLTEKTNDLTVYTATVTEALSGWHRWLAKDGSGNAISSGVIYLDDTTTTRYGAGDFCVDVLAAGAGQTAAEAVWAYSSRTLTQSSTSIASALAGSEVTFQRGDTISVAFTGLGAITGYLKIWFTAKKNSNAKDSEALVLISDSVGLEVIAGTPAGTAGNGSITVDDGSAGDITVALSAVESAKLRSGGVYDVQWKNASSQIYTLTSGEFKVTADITQATS